MPKPTDIRPIGTTLYYLPIKTRVPLKFGPEITTECTLARVRLRVTDARGRTQHVHGPGVVGEQPVLGPGQSFDYTSGTPLDTPSGFMVGAYHMIVPGSGEKFDVAIPPFSLDSPHQSSRIH